MDRLAGREPRQEPGQVGSGRKPTELGGIPFASNAAAELAIRYRLTKDDFRGWTASGRHGFSAADVEDLMERVRRDRMAPGYEVKG
jgi:hypothetical protein